MSSAKVTFKEIDLSTRIPSFPGIFGAMPLQAKKGPLEPQLMTSDTQFLRVFTPDERIEVGFNTGYYSALTFLEKSNKLWIQRVVKDAFFSGAAIKRSDATTNNNALPNDAQLADPEAYLFDSEVDVAAVAHIERFTAVADVAGNSDGEGVLLQDSAGSVAFWIDTDDSGTTIPAWASAADRAVEVITIITGELIAVMATKLAAAINADSQFGAVASINDVIITHTPKGARITGADGLSFFVGGFTVDTAGVDEIDLVDEIMLIHAANPGLWGDDIGFKIIVDQEIVNLPGAFVIEVYKSSNLNDFVETFTVSRVEGSKDGFGNNLYIEDVLEGSLHIRAQDNLAVDDSFLPKAQATVLFMDGGDDGLAVTDTEMIAGAQKFKNPDDIFATTIMDTGFATPAYGQALDTVAKNRLDMVALLSTPLSDEAASDFINQIVAYRKTELNLNSSHSALYTPHVKINDRFNNRQIFIAPDGFAGAAISFSASNFEVFFPPAGFKRGGFNAIDLRRRFSEGERDELQRNGINPLRFAPGKGLAIWGQKTLLSQASALDRLNVRLLLTVVKPAVKEALENFLFELNDAATRSIATALLESFFGRIKGRRGIKSFSVVIDDTNNGPDEEEANQMIVDIFFRPTRSTEDIPVRMVITSSNLTFEQAAAALSAA